jgi:hypothetical protein
MSSTHVPTHSVPSVRPATSALRLALGIVLAIAIAIMVNTGVAWGARALSPGGSRTGLILVAYGPLTVLGVLAGTVGWLAVRRFAAQPRAVLRVLVPAVVVLSFVPGVIQLAAGTGPVDVVGLWVMHLVVAIVTVGTLLRVLPLPDKNM